jgi:hypothetical protein
MHPTELESEATLRGVDGEERVFERSWHQRIKRELV